LKNLVEQLNYTVKRFFTQRKIKSSGNLVAKPDTPLGIEECIRRHRLKTFRTSNTKRATRASWFEKTILTTIFNHYNYKK
jgi:hypothetical protein